MIRGKLSQFRSAANVQNFASLAENIHQGKVVGWTDFKP